MFRDNLLASPSSYSALHRQCIRHRDLLHGRALHHHRDLLHGGGRCGRRWRWRRGGGGQGRAEEATPRCAEETTSRCIDCYHGLP
ncbi:hypothetical protein QJS10_CPA10g01914 [Acorus calamus]|uniref:Uncharacterized protein n=1 Tax=Acorus calamus TaxID=4465 RepID=A0AAV9DZN7_ACOCL|nr:hypothetical protein QJS10_CPA10g01914 [Acorus calamus]